MTGAFILILAIEGWGYGLGSAGNGLAVAEFGNEKACKAALQAIKGLRGGNNPVRGICVPKFVP